MAMSTADYMREKAFAEEEMYRRSVQQLQQMNAMRNAQSSMSGMYGLSNSSAPIPNPVSQPEPNKVLLLLGDTE